MLYSRDIDCNKNKCDKILNNWKITLQALDNKGRYFLDLLDDDLKSIEPTYSKRGLWLQFFGHFNPLCTKAIRAITNHTSIEEYQLRFFPQE